MTKTFPAACRKCGVSLPPGAPRLVVEGWWWCPDCVYREEIRQDAPEMSKPPRANRKHPQKETLFDALGDVA